MNAERAEPGSCVTCKFWDRMDSILTSDEVTGSCRRFPPTAETLGDEYPETVAGDWCGEWKQSAPTAELERKLAAFEWFANRVRSEAEESPELYAPFVRLVRDLDVKMGAK